MIRTISRLCRHIRMFAWRWHRRDVARELLEHEIFRDGGLRISHFVAWGPFKEQYIVWRWRPSIRRARIYGYGLLFGEAAVIVKSLTRDNQGLFNVIGNNGIRKAVRYGTEKGQKEKTYHLN